LPAAGAGSSLETLEFGLRQAEAVVEMAHPGTRGDLLQALDRSGAMNSPPRLHSATKAKSSSSALRAAKRASASASASPLVDGPQALDLGVAQQHLEAHAHFVDAVEDGFQLGGLVHHVLRRRDLAAVVQPGADPELAPLLVGR
jgi:hypothetical protein